MAEGRTMIFADGMTEASVTHGVARITLAQTGPDGKPVPVGQLCVPLLQLPGFANGIVNLLKQVEERAKQAQAQQGQQAGQPRPAAAPPAAPKGDVIDADAPPIAGAFRFSG
jgi:hypothetical protein